MVLATLARICVNVLVRIYKREGGGGREREIERENSNSLLYQTPRVYVQGGSSEQFNSRSDISFGKSLSKVYTGGREQQSNGQS